MGKSQAVKVAEAKVKPLSEDLVLYHADREFKLDPGSYSVRPQPQAMAYAANLAKATGLTACNLITSAGADATHVHIVPRRPGDGLALVRGMYTD